MRTVFRFISFLLGTGLVLQFIYWATLEVGYGLGQTNPPAVSHDWLFFAFVNSAIWMGGNTLRTAKRLWLSLKTEEER